LNDLAGILIDGDVGWLFEVAKSVRFGPCRARGIRITQRVVFDIAGKLEREIISEACEMPCDGLIDVEVMTCKCEELALTRDEP
jgi:hypothetical protein